MTAIGIDWPFPNVARLTIDNPDHRNALTLAMWQSLGAACDDLCQGPARAVVIRGAGTSAFSTGADISEFQTLRHDAVAMEAYNQAITRAMAALRDLPLPVIAQLDGLCVGGGLALAAMADLRLAGDTCRFGIPAGKLGIAYRPEWINRIADLAGPASVAEMLLTAGLFTAGDALHWRFVNRIVPAGQLGAVTGQLAARIAGLAPLTHRATKAALAARAGHGTPAEADRCVTACDDSQDYRRGVLAFAARSKPVFEGN